jgi:hypothetical protein
MKALLKLLMAVGLMTAATSSYAWFWDDDNDWECMGPFGEIPGCNPYDEWDPRYWMEEMENEFDDDDDYYYRGGYGGPYGGYGGPYGGYGSPYGPPPGYGAPYGGGYGSPYGPPPGYAPQPAPQQYAPAPQQAPQQQYAPPPQQQYR